MKDRHREQWEKLGTEDPYWAVLTDPDKKSGKWNSTEFFNRGEKEIRNILSKLKEIDVEINKKGIALDFGCGVGRVSRALAKEFKKVIAVDVSKSMLNEARKANQDLKNIEFIHNTAEDLEIISDSSIDFLYSNIVLQHMPKKRQILYIKEFCRILSSGSVLAIQTPSNCNLNSQEGWLFLAKSLLGSNILNILRKIKNGPAAMIIEVHTLPKKIVLETLNQQGMDILHVERYDSAGPALESYMYFAKKKE